MSDWQTLINEALQAGYSVSFDAECEGWVVHTPKAFRKAAMTLGTYADERAALRGAAFLAKL